MCVMRQRVLNIFVVLAALLIVVGCSTDSATKNLLLRAEALAEQAPEQALAALDSVDVELVRGKHDMAHYQLVRSEVLYHNYVDSDSDTLTRAMVEYYMASNHDHECARALYQHSLVLKRKGVDHLAEAMVSLIEAKKRLERVDDMRLKALVLRTEADIYGAGCLFANALESYGAAKQCFDELGMEYHSASVLYDMGATYIQLREHWQAKRALDKALSYGVKVDNKRFMCAVLHELLELSIYLDDYEMCSQYVDMFDEYDCLLFGQAHMSATKAMILSHEGHKNEALAIVERAAKEPDADWADLEYARYIIYRNVGDSKEALRWEERSKHQQDDLMIKVLEQPVLNIQIEMLQRSVDAANRERKLVRQRNTLIYCTITALVILVGYVLLRRMRRKNEAIAHYVETIHELSVALDNVPREMSSSLGALYRDRFSELNELCDIYYDHSGSSRHKSMVFNKLTETIDMMKSDSTRITELERAVDEYRDGLMRRLRELLPRLSERDYRVALYSFAGFSSRAIAIFIDSDPVSVSKIKYNIKTKIKGVEGVDTSALVAAISEK